MSDNILDGVQATVEGDWLCVHYVCIAAFERVSDDGCLEVSTVLYTPGGQASYISEGLLGKASEIQYCTAEEDLE